MVVMVSIAECGGEKPWMWCGSAGFRWQLVFGGVGFRISLSACKKSSCHFTAHGRFHKPEVTELWCCVICLRFYMYVCHCSPFAAPVKLQR